MSIQEINTEEFLEIIKENPAVWDHNCEEYRVPARKSQAWEAVCKAFIENYEDLSKHDRLVITKKLQNKWRNLRDSYVRNAKKKATEGGRNYIYYKNLAFLASNYAGKIKSKDSSESEDSSDDEDNSRRKRIKKERDSPVPVLRRNTSSDYLEYVQSNGDVDALVPMNSTQEIDDDKLFFESLLPATRQFDIDQKLQFRSEVLSLIAKIRKDHRNSTL